MSEDKNKIWNNPIPDWRKKACFDKQYFVFRSKWETHWYFLTLVNREPVYWFATVKVTSNCKLQTSSGKLASKEQNYLLKLPVRRHSRTWKNWIQQNSYIRVNGLYGRPLPLGVSRWTIFFRGWSSTGDL